MSLPTKLTLFLPTPPVELPYPPLVITVPEAWRAEIYRPFLEEAWREFQRFSARHPKLAMALAQPGVVEQLARVLDDYVGPGVVADVNAFAGQHFRGENITEETYVRYVVACLEGDVDPYRPTVSIDLSSVPAVGHPRPGIESFFSRYPLIRYMLSVMTDQYISALERCGERLLADWPDLELFFAGGQPLLALTELKGTGSDFHKGGQQVLILTFATDDAPFKLVYKPSDVERDFRIVGDTVALSAVIERFRSVSTKGVSKDILLNNPLGSLVEMVAKLANAEQIRVSKYKILPVHPGSSLPAPEDGSCPIRASYGWLEFLSHDEEDRNFPNRDALRAYYEAFGTFVGLAYLFQIIDLHNENVILHAKQPCLIDLEASCAGIMQRASTTTLQAAFNVFKAPSLKRDIDGWGSPQLVFGLTGESEATQNQPYIDEDPYKPDRTDSKTVADSFLLVSKLVLANVETFNGWIANAPNLVVRIVPLETRILLPALRAIHYPGGDRAAKLPDDIPVRTAELARINVHLVEGAIAGWGDEFYTDAKAANVSTPYQLSLIYNISQPRFACWLSPQTAEDFAHGDVPVFYRRKNQLLDSRGVPLNVPFGRAVEETKRNPQPLAELLIAIWQTKSPLLPTIYFPYAGPNIQVQYLTQMSSGDSFGQERIEEAADDIVWW